MKSWFLAIAVLNGYWTLEALAGHKSAAIYIACCVFWTYEWATYRE
jgi:hypothetical protein